MKFLISALVLLVSSAAWGDATSLPAPGFPPDYCLDGIAWQRPGKEPKCFDFVEVQAQLLLLEKRIEALEVRAKRVNDWGPHAGEEWCAALIGCEWNDSYCICTNDADAYLPAAPTP